MGTLTLIGKSDGSEWIWDYQCGCGVSYRVAAVLTGARFWPATDPARLSAPFLKGGDSCVGCGRLLTLEACEIRDRRATA